MHDIDLKEYYEKKAIELDEIALTYKHPSPYKRFFFHTRFDKVFSALNPKKGEYILELGCGSGYYTKKIVQKGTKVLATDFSANYVKQAKKYVGKNKNASYQTADATKLLFKNNTFDKILFTEVIEHIPEYKESLKEIKRVLKKNGIAIISTPSRFSPMNLGYQLKRKIKKYSFNEHVREFTPNEFKVLVNKYLSVEKIEFANFLFPYPIDMLFLESKSKKLIMILNAIEKFSQKTPIIKYLGWTIIITARKK